MHRARESARAPRVFLPGLLPGPLAGPVARSHPLHHQVHPTCNAPCHLAVQRPSVPVMLRHHHDFSRRPLTDQCLHPHRIDSSGPVLRAPHSVTPHRQLPPVPPVLDRAEHFQAADDHQE